MLTNDKPKINQNIPRPAPAGGAGAGECHPLQHVRALLGLSRRRFKRNEILHLIDTREIRWAWDISRAGSRRPEIRIWRDSLLEFLAREAGGEQGVPRPESPDYLSDVIARILPRPISTSSRASTLSFNELQRRWLCCRTLLNCLVADGDLCQVEGALPTRAPVILHQSAVEFLRRRAMAV